MSKIKIPKNSNIVDQVLKLQCKIKSGGDACQQVQVCSKNGGVCKLKTKNKNEIKWKDWAKENLSFLYEKHPNPLDFVKNVYSLFLNQSKTEFKDLHWDFLKSLFESATCNCVCGTLFVICAAQYVGLYPLKVWARCGPAHIFIVAQDSNLNENFILETTLRPGNPRWIISEADSFSSPFYCEGAYFDYRNDYYFVQEAFINEFVLKSMEGVEEDLQQLEVVLEELVFNQESKDLIMDVLMARIKQLLLRLQQTDDNVSTHDDKDDTSNDNKTSHEEDNNIIFDEILDRIKGIIERIEHCDCPEVYLKDILFVVQVYSWQEEQEKTQASFSYLSAQHFTSSSLSREESSLLYDDLRRRLLLLIDIIHDRREKSLWGDSVERFKQDWCSLLEYLKFL